MSRRKPNSLPNVVNDNWVEGNCTFLLPNLYSIEYEYSDGEHYLFYYKKCAYCGKWFFNKEKNLKEDDTPNFYCCAKHRIEFKKENEKYIKDFLIDDEIKKYNIIEEKKFDKTAYKIILVNGIKYCYGKCSNCGMWSRIKDHFSRFLSRAEKGEISCCSNSCSTILSNHSIDCLIHGHQEMSFGGKCIKCIHETEEMKEHTHNQALKNLKYLNGVYWKQPENVKRKSEIYYMGCFKYIGSEKQKEHLTYLNTRINNQPEKRRKAVETILHRIETEELDHWPGAATPNFIVKDNVRTYKGIPVDYLTKQILNEEVDINDYPRFEIRCGHVCYNCRDIITDEFINIKGSFNIVDGRKYYKNEPIDALASKILNKEVNIDDYPGFEICCGRVCYYTIDILTDKPIYLDSNFNIVDGVKFYKNIPVSKVVEGILNKTLDMSDFPGLNIRLGRVCYGTHDVLTDETIYLQQNFQTRDGVKFYKNEPIDIVISKLESGEYNITEDCPGWNKRFGEWYYGTVNVLTGEVTTLNGSNFETKNNILYYYDVEVDDYVPWDRFKNNFENDKKIPDNIIDFKRQIQQDYPDHNVAVQPTFRTQDSKDWSGAKSAFEMSLVEKNIGWFTYIKFYIKMNDRKCIKPLVGGKSGSLLVNETGFDVSFSENVEDGPARVFLYESDGKYSWYKEEVLIINCGDNESEALRIESEIQKKYNLFGS